jgi:predicted unusual protein kinase regulating ubiquinone biosynthesis (AarF/ABC1/UbiB family)
MVFQQINSITVECLPANIPDRVEADVSTMSELHSTVHGSDLKLPANVTTTLDPGEVVASISRRMEAEEEVEAEAAAAEEVEEATSSAEAAESGSEQSGEGERN